MVTPGGRAKRLAAVAHRLLSAGVDAQVFPGASAAVGFLEGDRFEFAEACAGTTAPGSGVAGGARVQPETLFDLASLTKPFLAMSVLRLAEAGQIELNARVGDVVRDARGWPTSDVTLESLLRHKGGLASWGAFHLDVPHPHGSAAARRWIVLEALRRPQEGGNQGKVLYSDLGYIVAGDMLSRALRKPLDVIVEQCTLEPLALTQDVFYASNETSGARRSRLDAAAPTEMCNWRSRLIRGEVHDENCAALGGVAGHAGLFGTASAVARFGSVMLEVLQSRSTFLKTQTLRQALMLDEGALDGNYRLGWDTKTQTGSSAGTRMSAETFGHLGFTGTSIWCDPTRQLVVVLLSNRVCPTRANERIRAFRPAFHDGVVAAFDEVAA